MVGNRLVHATFIFAACAPLAFSQASGSLTGSVTDSTGGALPNAKVSVILRGGKQALMEARTNAAGLFSFIAVRPEAYDVEVEAPGFAKYIQRDVKVDAIRETNLVIKMEVAATQQVVEVTADVQAVQLANSEVSNLITQQQIDELPALDRQVSQLFSTQAGVSSARGPTVINGMRTTFANVTLDGVNVQDNFLRNNSLDYMPYRTTIDQISEVTISVSNSGSTIGGGAAQVAMVTKSGSNQYHGSAYWYNRNNATAANDWFNNRSGIGKPFLNLNQMGASLGGKIIRDKLFFFGNYEAFRLREQESVLRTVLTPSAKQGIFQYRPAAGGSIETRNVLGLRQARIDPAMQALVSQLPEPNTTDAGDGINTGGYRFNANANSNRDQIVTRWDYYLNSSSSFTGTWNRTKEITNRPDAGAFYTVLPPVFNENPSNLVSVAWRWTMSPVMTNELRGGFSLAPGKFNVRNEYPEFLVSNLAFGNPVNTFLAQGRDTNTYSIQDNANRLQGKHDLAFGFQTQMIRARPFNDAGILPDYSLGISAANQNGLTATDLAGARSQDVNLANQILSNLAGYINEATQLFNVRDRSSGFVPNYTNVRNFAYDTYSGYFQDKWKMRQNLTVTLGLRYEYWTRFDEKDALFLLPPLKNGNFIQTLLDPNATLDFAGGAIGRPAYRPDRNNFAPNIGFAFDPTGKGKTAIRGSYMISYVNDETIAAMRNNVNTNAGLQGNRTLTRQTAVLANRPQIAPPLYKVPRTVEDNYLLNPTSAAGMPDPNFRSPYLQAWQFGIQQEIKGNIVEFRYVGNRGTKMLRAIDYNQVVIRENGFLDDFLRARSNGRLSLAAGRGFNPDFSAAVPGSQRLTVFPQLALGGLLTNATVQNLIRTGEPGSLGEIYQTNGLNGAVNFFRNPNILGANAVVNGADSTYHALQVDLRRRGKGVDFQANYTFSKALSNGVGDDSNRFEPLLDLESPSLERGRSPFDLTHAIKANGSWDIPFGRGRKFELRGIADKAFGGWVVSGIMSYTSGTAFSVFSNRGTVNRGGRATGRNTATALVTKSELDQRVGRLVMTGNGPFFIDPSAIGTDGRGTASDGSPAFTGQLFYNPDPGFNGALQRRMFSGPWNFNLDNSLLKTVSIKEGHAVQIRADFYNILNTPSFWVGNETTATTRFNINQPTFGRVIGVFNDRRILQFGLYYRF